MSLVFCFPIPETIFLIDWTVQLFQGFPMQMQLDLDWAFFMYACCQGQQFSGSS